MTDDLRIEHLRRRIQLNPASIAFADLAEAYRQRGDLDAAIATCIAGLKRHPAYVSARVTLGRTLMEAGRYREAQEAFECVLRTSPENPAAIACLAEIRSGCLQACRQQPRETATPLATTAVTEVAASSRVDPPERSQLGMLKTFLAAIEHTRRLR